MCLQSLPTFIISWGRCKEQGACCCGKITPAEGPAETGGRAQPTRGHWCTTPGACTKDGIPQAHTVPCVSLPMSDTTHAAPTLPGSAGGEPEASRPRGLPQAEPCPVVAWPPPAMSPSRGCHKPGRSPARQRGLSWCRSKQQILVFLTDRPSASGAG